jgi:hypothetical protein
VNSVSKAAPAVQQQAQEAAPVKVAPVEPQVSSSEAAQTSQAQAASVGLSNFVASLANYPAGTLAGVYVDGVFALPVVQQPAGSFDYVSSNDGVLTQYSAPSQFGVIAIIAHNYLSGRAFFHLKDGQEIVLVYGGGYSETYRITKLERYQALSPANPYSDFINLNDAAQTVQSFQQVFNRYYTDTGSLVLQTCIEAQGNPSWGRIFIRAEK